MIRVLQVFTVMNRGGAESMIMNYYRNINRNIIQFDFLVHRSEKAAFDDEIKKLGGEIFILPKINPFFPNDYYKSLRSFFEKNKNYSIVHSHLNTFSYFPLKVAEEFNIPYRIAHAHTATEGVKVDDLTSFSGIKESLKKITKFYLKRKIEKHTTHYFSCGKKAGNWLFGFSNMFNIMNNAIDAKKFVFNEEKANEVKQQLSIEGKLVLGHIGNFSTPKNHIYLLKIFKQVLLKNNESVLVLVGDGLLKEKIEKEAKQLSVYDKIIFLGVRSDISDLCQAFDVFVFPSLYEGLPVTLIEAQAAGLKIIASDSITKEVHITNDISFLSIKSNPEIWASKIEDIMKYKRDNNFQKIVNSGYDIRSSVLAMEEFYLALKK